MGERVEPARAPPRPFCLYGFLPPPETSARVLVLCVPALKAANSALTERYTTCSLGVTAKTESCASIFVPAFFPFVFNYI